MAEVSESLFADFSTFFFQTEREGEEKTWKERKGIGKERFWTPQTNQPRLR